MTLAKINTSIDWDWKFFAILPAFNLNLHSCSVEFEWLWLGIYINTN